MYAADPGNAYIGRRVLGTSMVFSPWAGLSIFFVFVPAMLQVWFSTCNLHLRRFAGRLQLSLGSTLYSALDSGQVCVILILTADTANAAMTFPPRGCIGFHDSL